MQSHVSALARILVALGASVALVACSHSNNNGTGITVGANAFTVTRLVANPSGPTAISTDADLQNAWGVSFGPTGLLWVADNHTGMSTVYDATGVKQSTSVSLLGAGGTGTGAPTGLVYNGTTDFNIGLIGGPATFIFAGEDGTISAWNPASGTTATIVADQSASGAVYKGIAIAPLGSGQSLLFATDFHNNSVDVYDASFAKVNSFTDPDAAAGYAPFGIQYMGDGRVWVTYALQLGPDNEDDQPGPGHGFVDIFSTDGALVERFATGGKLNSPWAIVRVPDGFGGQGGRFLIGNFGDGKIGVYDGAGHFVTNLHDAAGADISIDGLWGLTFGPTTGSTTLYFAAGPNDEQDGLMGTITPQ